MSSAAPGAPKPTPLASATTLLLREGKTGLEVFMVKRHHQIDFASGALVFPGGKLAKGDADSELRNLTDGVTNLTNAQLSLAACAIREGFEESGILLARKPGEKNFVSGELAASLSPWRPRLDKGEAALSEFLAANDLRLAADALQLFAHWVTPTFMPKRFDTFFFLAEAPPGQLGSHDGRESVDSLWIAPDQAMAEKDKWTIIFPTKMNLLKLARAKSVADALDRARREHIVTVEPKIIEKKGKQFLTIPIEAGYGEVEEPLGNLRG
jgi:8-oxo-dGTP pyrophosphatase MutT (NUDIX family)